MKITIESETPEEKAQLTEPWVRAGVRRIGLAGRMDPAEKDFEFGFIHGPWPQVKAELARLVIDGDAMSNQQQAVNAVLQAHNVIAQQIEAKAIGDSLRNGHGHHPRIAR